METLRKKLRLLKILLGCEVAGMVIATAISRLGIFVYYTQDSNLVLLVATLLYVLDLKKHIEAKGEGEYQPSPFIATFFYVATCLVTVTFVTVVLVLTPMGFARDWMTGIWVLAGGASLFHHLICPIMAIYLLLTDQREQRITMKETLWATMPTLGYAIVTTTLNALDIMYGPYPFLHVHEQPVIVSVIWFITIPFGGFIIAVLLRKFANYKIDKNLSK